MLNKKQTTKLIDELGYSPLAKPWQLQHLIDTETSYQKYKLFRAVTWGRLLIALIIFILLLNDNVSHLAHSLPIISMGISIWALKTIRDIDDNAQLYALFYAIFDILTFTYITKYSSNSYEIGFIFFTLAYNAMLLPFMQLLLITCLGAILLFIGWIDKTFSGITTLSHTANFLEHITEGRRLEEITTLLIGLFIVVFTVHRLAKRSLENEVKAIIQHKQLRQILSFNRSIIENFNNGIIIFSADTDTQILSINKKAIELLNINDGEKVMALSDLSSVLFDQYNSWSSSLFGSSGADDSFTYQHNQGAEEVFVTFTEFTKTNQNSIIMMTLESLNKTMQQAQEARLVALGRLTAGVAHEIRNPLASISSAADLLNENSDEETKKKLTAIIANNVQRTNRIINDILGLFKDKKGNRELLSVDTSLHNFAETFNLSNSTQHFNISVKTDCKENLFFKFDTTQLEQILWNLCSNSIKYAKKHNLLITIKYELSTHRKRLYIYVYDNGSGINEDRAKRIFEPFYAGSSEGSGLGLYLVRELCNANNANITYLLPKDRDYHLHQGGACFRISTPVYFSKNIKPKID